MTRLIQIQKEKFRRVALVEEPRVRFLEGCSSIYELAQMALEAGKKLEEGAHARVENGSVDYDALYTGRSEWRLLPPIDHPGEPARCMVSGTGLTHVGSARDRQSMH